MSFNFDCIGCNINQVIRIINLLDLSKGQGEKIVRAVLKYLSETDYSKCNPELVCGTWNLICKHAGDSDPYRDTKAYYNLELLKLYEEISGIINAAENKFSAALKIAIAGNLIDFAAKHTFDMETVKQKIIDSKNMRLDIDHSGELYESLGRSKSLLYLGDNCGEIVLDKLFIEIIKKEFPGINVFYGVRGKPVANDVTVTDAQMTEMEKAAVVIDNGDGSSGTVIHRVSPQFRKIFYEADIVISKGQGNYESLSSIDRENVFFLFMSKCEAVAKPLGVKTMAILCIKNTPPQSEE